MAKVRGCSLYADAGEMLNKGKKHPAAKEIENFCKDVLDKNFENWVVVGRDRDPRNFKEVEGGDLMSGMILMNLGTKNAKDKVPDTPRVRNIDAKSNLAMMILDLVEAVCDDEDEAEKFLEALTTTIKHAHEHDRKERGEGRETKGMGDDGKPMVIEYDTKEEMKIEVLKDLLWNGIGIFNSYKSKEQFLRSCLSSLVVARVLAGDDEGAKNRMRESMRASIRGDKEGGRLAVRSVDGIDNFLDILLKAIDDDKSPEEISKLLQTFTSNL